jgi:protein-S-isoprenylcysteine O-methyltransferase Ste14
MENIQNRKILSGRSILIRSVIAFLVTIALVFISAGTLNYWQGWLFVAFYVLISLLAITKLAGSKDLMSERIKPGPDVKWWDKIIFRIYVPLNSVIIVISSLDGGRFHWSPHFPAVVYIISFAVMSLSYAFIMWAMWTNNFFSSRVRIQTDRGQYVVQQGPYSFVRHPGYLGVLFWQPSIPIVLGSLWGLIPAALAVITIIIRTYLEDRMLQKELPGYIDYTKKVPYRLIPGIW